MRRVAFVSLAVVALLVSSSTVYADCTCESAKIKNGWCQDCKVGYIAGVKIASKKLYDALQGKALADTSKMKCEGCKRAVAKDGKCQHCKLGFVNKTAYKSMPAYCLARGEVKDPATIKCPRCRAVTARLGWSVTWLSRTRRPTTRRSRAVKLCSPPSTRLRGASRVPSPW